MRPTVGWEYASSLNLELSAKLKVGLGDKSLDLLFALNNDRKGWCLHPPNGCEEKAPVARIKGGHRPCAVNTDQPVRL